MIPVPVVAGWKVAKAVAGKVPREVWQGLALLVLILLARHHWIGVGEDREAARWAERQAKADELQAKAVAKRDKTATAIATDSHAAAAKDVAATKAATDEREARIAAVPVSGACRFPDGLPELAPAVEAANAARRPTVP
jgi:hypothetical protein